MNRTVYYSQVEPTDVDIDIALHDGRLLSLFVRFADITLILNTKADWPTVFRRWADQVEQVQ